LFLRRRAPTFRDEREARLKSLYVASVETALSEAAAMILGIGTDLLDVARMATELAKEGGGFRDDVFTPAEIAYCQGKQRPARHFAARFAAKEAFFKALEGRAAAGFLDVEVTREGGAPRLVLRGAVKETADRLGVLSVHVSLSHSDDLATASVVLEG
jgi:holo-[acyl-carrier protein] synthase